MKNTSKPPAAATKKVTSATKRNHLLPATIAIGIIVFTYFSFSPVLTGGFTNWDDDTYVTGNTLVTARSIPWKELFVTPVALNYHPITMITLAWNYQAAALNPRAYHATNLLLHLLNSALVFFLFYHLSGRKIMTSAISGILFGIHPMHVESVAWISERKDVLYVFFFLLALLAYLRYCAIRKMGWLFLCFLFFVLSCLSKAMGVILPLVLLLFDYYQQRKITLQVLLEKIPFFIVSAVLGVIALRIQSGSANEAVQSFSILQRLIFGSYGCIVYLIKFLAPLKLSAFYPYPIADGSQALPVLFYITPLALLVIIYLVYRNLHQQFVVFGFLFFIVTITLVLQFISVGNVLMADRYSYLSYAGLSFIAGYGFEKLWQQRSFSHMIMTVALSILILFFCFITHERAKVWSSSETLWSDVISKYPSATIAYKNRGNYYGQNGNSTAALADYKVLLSMNTMDPEVYNNLGNIYLDQKKLPESINAYSKAIALNPGYINAYINRGISFNAAGRPDKAIEDFSKAIQLNPKKASTLAQRGFTYYSTGKLKEAIKDFTAAVELQPTHASAWYYLGLSNYQLEQKADALHDLMKAKALGYEGDFSLIEKMK